MFTAGALGHGDKKFQWKPKQVDAFGGEKIVSIAASHKSSFAIDAQGRCWCWGEGENGALGHGSSSSSLEPVNVAFTSANEPDESKAVKVCAGNAFTAVLLENGRVYTWGKNDQKQLGVSAAFNVDMHSVENVPQQVEGVPDPVADIATGDAQCVAITTKGQAYW